MKRLAVFAALVVAASCSDTTAATFAAEAGTYALLSINNDPLPAPFVDNNTTVTVTAGSMVLNANGTFTYSQTSSGGTVSFTGTFTKSGSNYTFDPDGAGQENAAGVISGSTLTLTTGSAASGIDTRVYQKS